MKDYSDQSKERIAKLNALKKEGHNPYPNDFRPTNTAIEIHEKHKNEDKEALEKIKQTYKVAGRVMGYRSFGKAAFLQLQDRTGKIQAYVAKDVLGEKKYTYFRDFVDIGDMEPLEVIIAVQRPVRLYKVITAAVRVMHELI